MHHGYIRVGNRSLLYVVDIVLDDPVDPVGDHDSGRKGSKRVCCDRYDPSGTCGCILLSLVAYDELGPLEEIFLELLIDRPRTLLDLILTLPYYLACDLYDVVLIDQVDHHDGQCHDNKLEREGLGGIETVTFVYVDQELHEVGNKSGIESELAQENIHDEGNEDQRDLHKEPFSRILHKALVAEKDYGCQKEQNQYRQVRCIVFEKQPVVLMIHSSLLITESTIHYKYKILNIKEDDFKNNSHFYYDKLSSQDSRA